MKVLCVGDVVSRVGRDMLFRYVEELKYQKNIDFVIVNGENSNHGRGMTRSCYNEMKRAGADVFTMGNHVWGAKEVISVMEQDSYISKEVVEEGIGFAVKNGDSAEFENAIRLLSEDPDLAKTMGKKARNLYHRKYRYEIAMAKYRDAIESVLKA